MRLFSATFFSCFSYGPTKTGPFVTVPCHLTLKSPRVQMASMIIFSKTRGAEDVVVYPTLLSGFFLLLCLIHPSSSLFFLTFPCPVH